MTSSALDRTDRDAVEASLRMQHDHAGSANDELLPCRTNDPELWFAESAAEVEVAKAHCAGCPVQQLCLAGALERREPWGIWGGQVFLQGAVITGKRGRGRPRKDQTAAGLDAATATSGAGEVVTVVRSSASGGRVAPASSWRNGRGGARRGARRGARLDVQLG
jgi:WhiB family transcriptional regulator, redox-sensing transcriptional regulator